AYAGAVAAQESSATRRYLGLALLPQAGVAIGLILVLQDTPQFMHVPYMGQMVNIVLASILVNEILGPPLTKYALVASGSVGRKRRPPSGGSATGNDTNVITQSAARSNGSARGDEPARNTR
ncbi:hypothetical protein K8S17_07050, partial [bacterium]|nr:hypothetical protein [bacterium]